MLITALTKENLNSTKNVGMEWKSGQMVINMMANERITRWMDMGLIIIRMRAHIRVNGQRENNMDLVSKYEILGYDVRGLELKD